MHQKLISNKNEKCQHTLHMQISSQIQKKKKKWDQGNHISLSKLTKGQKAWSLSLVYSVWKLNCHLNIYKGKL